MIQTHTRRRIAGFTLVEMLVTFAIIAVLIGLLVPVIAGALRRGQEAAELAEIHNVATNIVKFKDRFPVYPPSQIILREDGDYSTTTLGVVVTDAPTTGVGGVFLREVSVQYLRRLWPQIVLNTSSTAGNSAYVVDKDGDGSINDSNEFFDWDGDGAFDDNTTYLLSGDECLVFFLAGVPEGESPNDSTIRTGQGPPGGKGFSKDPLNPTLVTLPGAGASRDGPFHEFESSRLVDWDGNGFWEFLPLRRPGLNGGYAYFSSYEGAGYRPDDMNILGTEPNEADNSLPENCGSGIAADEYIEFRVSWRMPINTSGSNAYPAAHRGGYTVNSGNVDQNSSVESPGPNPYTVGLPFLAANVTARYHKPDSFQLISPGTDNAYGQGGAYPREKSSSSSSPYYTEAKQDDDNLSNFGKARLGEVVQ
jgi:competence protein ComGC